LSESFVKTFNQSFFASAKKDWERKQPQGVATPWEFPGEGAFALLEAQKLHTHDILHNARHIKRAAFFGGGLLFLQLACQVRARNILLTKRYSFDAPTKWVCR
jgi:hypothetical protein